MGHCTLQGQERRELVHMGREAFGPGSGEKTQVVIAVP
jgi:hypothetical protein